MPPVTIADVAASIAGGGWPTSPKASLQRYAKYSKDVGNPCFADLFPGLKRSTLANESFDSMQASILDTEDSLLVNQTYDQSNLSKTQLLAFSMEFIYESDQFMEHVAGHDPWRGDFGAANDMANAVSQSPMFRVSILTHFFFVYFLTVMLD